MTYFIIRRQATEDFCANNTCLFIKISFVNTSNCCQIRIQIQIITDGKYYSTVKLSLFLNQYVCEQGRPYSKL